MRIGSARVAAAVLVVFVAAGIILAALIVPWRPVPGGMPEPVPAASVFSAEQIRSAELFARWARLWSWGGLLTSLAAYSALALPRGRRRLSRLPGAWWVRLLLAVAVVESLVRAVGLPWDVAQHQHLWNAGLTRQSWGGFAGDEIKGLGVAIVTTAIGLVTLVGIARRLPRAWPAVAAPVLAGLVLIGSYAYPVLVEPVFNRFTPLPDSPLRTQILRLADREGVPIDDVLVADASRRTTTLNAYVSGFGDTRRVVLYDTLVRDQPTDEVLSVVAHELAHAKHDDVLTGSALGALGAGAGVALLGLILAAGERRRRWPEISETAALPLILALMAYGSLLSAPAVNLVSRQIETRADVDALRTYPDGATFVELQRQLALRARSDPTPPAVLQFWFGSHPTVLQRVALAQHVAGSDG